MSPEMIEFLKKIAEQKAVSDDKDFNAYDYSGGNFDDAFSIGLEDGEIFLARTILTKLGGVYGE